MKGLWINIAICFFCGRELVAEELVQPAESIVDAYNWKAFELLIWDEGDQKDPNNANYINLQYRIAYEDRLLPSDLHYLAASAFTLPLFVNSDYKTLNGVCMLDPPRADDFMYQNRCLYAYDIPAGQRIDSAYEIGEKAFKANPTHTDGSAIYAVLGDYLTNLSRNNEGIRAYKRGFEMIPPQAAEEIAEARINMAYAYTNPMLSDELKKQAIKNYNEVLAYYKKQNGAYYRSQEMIIGYNLGIAQLFLFQDYKPAIENFKRAQTHTTLGVDAQVFLAFAYAKSGQARAARETLKTVDISTKTDIERINFLTCYRDLTLFLLGDKVSLQACLTMPSPQPDVLLHLTDTLSELTLPPAEENMWWRMFYRNFKKNLLPDVQNAISSAGAEAELVKERAEGRLKDLKLQNLTLYQSLVGTLAALALLLGIAGFYVWKARAISQRERVRLQNILDSIEEGIFLIHADLSMLAEESNHLKKILGAHYRPHMSLVEFLELTSLPPDQMATQIACLKAAIDEDVLAWELNLGNLVTELRLGNTFLALFWQPVFRQHRLHSIFLALRDVTDVHELKQANAKAQEDTDKVLIYVKELLQGNTQASMRFLNDLPSLFERLQDDVKEQQYSSALRIAHTVKGSARSLKLNDLREIVHQLETSLQKRDRTSIHDLFLASQAVSRLYRAAQHFVVEGNHQPTLDLFHIISELRAGVEQHLQEAGLGVGEIHVQESGRLTPFEYEHVREILLHGLTNATDHGFILPAQNGHSIRVPEIVVEVRATHQQRTLIIRDNGVGIEHSALKTLAEARGWQPQPGETWSDFLFTEGITTAKTVTMSSGRGVGLSAVKQAAQSMGGHVRLLDNDQSPGTMLEVTWDLQKNHAA